MRPVDDELRITKYELNLGTFRHREVFRSAYFVLSAAVPIVIVLVIVIESLELSNPIGHQRTHQMRIVDDELRRRITKYEVRATNSTEERFVSASVFRSSYIVLSAAVPTVIVLVIVLEWFELSNPIGHQRTYHMRLVDDEVRRQSTTTKYDDEVRRRITNYELRSTSYELNRSPRPATHLAFFNASMSAPTINVRLRVIFSTLQSHQRISNSSCTMLSAKRMRISLAGLPPTIE